MIEKRSERSEFAITYFEKGLNTATLRKHANKVTRIDFNLSTMIKSVHHEKGLGISESL